jgi:alkanesulfonate monooxygenase SsuD/methylene tetrahydromethanopterin reductase-like flavin-dependent oxidoreductase (luciferase family)
MRVGVGLPSTLPGAHGALALEWARRADAGPFASLGVLDRLVYDSFDPLVTLAAVAPLTRRVRLATTIVVSPLRSTALLAKRAATLDALSGGRLVLGLAVGARNEDYVAAGVPYATRGRRLVEQLGELRALWEEAPAHPQEGLGPAPARLGGPELLIGGTSEATFARVARYADGYVHGGGPPRAFARVAAKARAAWDDVGRLGRLQLWAQGYFALGDEATLEAGRAYLRDYYAFTGPFAERIVAGLLTTPQAIAQFLRGYATAGCDEMMLFPTVARLDQLDRLADVLARLGDRYADMRVATSTVPGWESYRL